MERHIVERGENANKWRASQPAPRHTHWLHLKAKVVCRVGRPGGAWGFCQICGLYRALHDQWRTREETLQYMRPTLPSQLFPLLKGTVYKKVCFGISIDQMMGSEVGLAAGLYKGKKKKEGLLPGHSECHTGFTCSSENTSVSLTHTVTYTQLN